MSAALQTSTLEYLLRLGDNALVLSHRLSEWCGKGPALEEDMALTNVALDLLGQARLWLSYAAELKGQGASPLSGCRSAAASQHSIRSVSLARRLLLFAPCPSRNCPMS